MGRDVTSDAGEPRRRPGDGLPAAAWEVDAELRVTWVGGALAALLGLDPAASGRLLGEVVGTEQAAPALAAARAALGGATRPFELQARGRVWRGACSPVREGEAIVGAAAVCVDATEQALADEAVAAEERRLGLASKLDAVGRLSGGVAHDLNNILTAMSGYTELLLDQLDPASPLRRYADQVKRACGRAGLLTEQLLAFGRKQVLAPRLLDLNERIRGQERDLREVLGTAIELALRLQPGLGAVQADPAQLDRVLVALLRNARDAMSRGGRVTIETAEVELDALGARAQPGGEAGRFVLLAISDTGVGMSSETLAHAFEPFFTTKEQGKGAGLGLSVVYGVVKQSGGWVWLYSEPDRGTTVKVYLPRAGEGAAPGGPAPAAVDAPPPGGTETVLLVEDDGMVRSYVRDLLRASGYTVLEARDGEQALALAGSHEAPIQLLLTDVVMPGLSGPEVAARLMPARPEARVLFTSGYTGRFIFENGLLDEGTHFLPKPFTRLALLGTVRRVLDGPR